MNYANRYAISSKLSCARNRSANKQNPVHNKMRRINPTAGTPFVRKDRRESFPMTTIGKQITFLVFDRLGSDIPELSIVIGIGFLKLIHLTNLTIAKIIPRPTPALTTIINANQSELSPIVVPGGIIETPGGVVGTCPTPPPPNAPFEAVGIPSAAPRADIYTRSFEV